MNSEGSVYYRKSDKRFVGKYRMPPDPLTGERKTKYIYGESGVENTRKEKQKVRALLNEFIEKIKSGDLSDLYNVTVEGFLKTWLKAHSERLAPTTANDYKNYVNNHIIPAIGSFLLKDLKPIQIEAFYNKELKKYKAKTVLQTHRILHKAFESAVKNGLMLRNVCDLVDAPVPEPFEIKVYDEEKFNKMLDCFEGTWLEIPVLLAGMCGLRRSEILGLRWDDIDLEKGTITINEVAVPSDKKIILKKPKSKASARTFAIPECIIPTLKKARGIGLVCPAKNGQHMNGSTFSRAFLDALKKYNLEHIRFHDLRHFNATMMLKYGVSDKEAANRLGHSQVSTTREIYQHVLEDMDKESANKLNAIYKKKSDNGVKIGVN
ncbi:site-specific integrase [Pseudoclostridium thermosuccinogenes]|uniref:tyrosine-type recombinase/integrase n=1 Tax=Clostridium thermosuccinogenes TaxID=84032 RepID=UPI002FD8F8F1